MSEELLEEFNKKLSEAEISSPHINAFVVYDEKV